MAGVSNIAFELEDPTGSTDNVSHITPQCNGTPEQLNIQKYRYGWGGFTSDKLQIFNKPVYFLVIVCLGAFFQGMAVTGISFTAVTSIEKQFGFTSTEVGLFFTGYDIAYGVCCIFVGYMGHLHKPRWLGIGFLILAIGSALTIIPKFLYGEFAAGISKSNDFCDDGNKKLCDSNGSLAWYYKFLFHMAPILTGIGATPLYTVGVAHLDEITDRGKNGLYLGIFFSCAALGPALGYIIGLPILNTWVDIKQPVGTYLTPEDNNWVGAWWLGYIIAAILLLVPVVPMLGFPRVFPNAEEIKKNKNADKETIQSDENLKHDFKSVWPATKSLINNKPFIFLCLGSASESIAIGGFSTFLPKFVETQFHFTASQAGFLSGAIIIIGVTGGMFTGGFLIKRFKWSCLTTFKAATVVAFTATLLVVSVLVGCDGRNVVGATVPYFNSTSFNEMDMNNQCNGGCSCSIKYYKPICTEVDQKTFYSPCHAGCFSAQSIEKNFYNCSCFPPNVNQAIDGRCKPDCTLVPLFFAGAFLLFFTTFLNNVPILNATLRVVPEDQGSFAMGFQQVFVRFLGFIPAPSLFGAFIDKSCVLWLRDECTNESKSCLEYNNKEFRYSIFGLGVIAKFLSFMFIFLAWRTYKLPVRKKRIDFEVVASHSRDIEND